MHDMRGDRQTRHTALLVIDVQQGLVELMPASVQDSVLPRIRELVAKARTASIPVVYIQHDGGKGHPLETNTGGWQLHSTLQPQAGELVIRKQASDSFWGTNLQRELEKRNVTHLVVAGAMTEYCVDTTCRHATSIGYDVTLASDAHLTRDNGVLGAAQIIAHHNLVLDQFGAGDHCIRVKPVEHIRF